MQSGPYSKVVEWVQEHSDTHVVMNLIPPPDVQQFRRQYPELGIDWMPAIALEKEHYITLDLFLKGEMYIDPQQNICLPQMYQNCCSVMNRIWKLFEEKGHEKGIKKWDAPDAPLADYYYHQLQAVKDYIRGDLMLSFIKGHKWVCQMKLDKKWIRFIRPSKDLKRPRTEEEKEALIAALRKNKDENLERKKKFDEYREKKKDNKYLKIPKPLPGGLFDADGIHDAPPKPTRRMKPFLDPDSDNSDCDTM